MKMYLGPLNICPCLVSSLLSFVNKEPWRYRRNRALLSSSVVLLAASWCWCAAVCGSQCVQHLNYTSLVASNPQQPASSPRSSLGWFFTSGEVFPSTLEDRFPGNSTGETPRWLVCHSMIHHHTLSNRGWITVLSKVREASFVLHLSPRGSGCYIYNHCIL